MTKSDMLQSDHLEGMSYSDDHLSIKVGDGARKRQPYQAVHPHSNHHRRVRATPKEPDPEVCITEMYDNGDASSPETSTANPNDPFEKHFLAAALAPKPEPGRSSSFRNDRPKPHVVKREPELGKSGNFSSSPNLLFPKDDLHYAQSHDNRGDAPLRRVRSFKTSSKGGVINRGDSFRKKHSSRNLASGSTNGRDSPRLAPASSQPMEFECTPQAESPQSCYFRVQVMGAPGCGKTSITNQFMSSDYANAYDSMNVDEVERTVSIQLDGEEYTMEFIDKLPWDVRMQDSDSSEWSPLADEHIPRDLEDCQMTDDTVDHDVDLNADAFIIVYSVIDRSTYDAAVASLYKLRHGFGTDRPIVLCGNKIDLVRKRRVKKDDVMSIARTYDCLTYETSAVLNHHVDELLVAILKQIRHKLNPNLYPVPSIPDLDMKRDKKGSFFSRLYKRLSRKGRSKSKK